MQITYISGSNTATNGQSLGAAGQDVKIFKILVGLPVASGNIIVYNKAIAFSGDTSNIAFKSTLPANISNASGTYPVIREWDFGEVGMQVDGGNVMIDQTMQVTVIWDFASGLTV